MTRHITVEQALEIASSACGGPVDVRDEGLLASALARPATTVMGEDAYPGLLDKAAALLHSLVTSHPLVDGNKRLGWLATWVFCLKNGTLLDPDDDEAYELIVAIAAGRLRDVDKIAGRLADFVAKP